MPQQRATVTSPSFDCDCNLTVRLLFVAEVAEAAADILAAKKAIAQTNAKIAKASKVIVKADKATSGPAKKKAATKKAKQVK